MQPTEQREATPTIAVIGVDAAVDAKNVGLARGLVTEGRLRLLETGGLARTTDALVEQIAAWFMPPTLLAIDAPLGWPRTLGQRLPDHRAGQPLVAAAHALFRRFTDCEVARRYRVTPLDVGADRIARTALAALDLLSAVRRRLGREVPLLWSPRGPELGAIEVYPAATLVARGLSRLGYKKEPALRRTLIDALAPELVIAADGPVAARMQAREHDLDAALCVLAGADFLGGRAPAPPTEHRELAEAEGWIWVLGR
jgi:hypothetical protein